MVTSQTEDSRPRRPAHWTPLNRAIPSWPDGWKLWVLSLLVAGPVRLSAIQKLGRTTTAFRGISAGALQARLRALEVDGMITSERFREIPPRVEFSLTQRGRDALAIATAYSNWALRHAWSAPEPGEVFSLRHFLLSRLPVLDLSPPRPFCLRADGEPEVYLVGGRQGGEIISPPECEVIRVYGPPTAWIAALSQPYSSHGLTMCRVADGGAWGHTLLRQLTSVTQ